MQIAVERSAALLRAGGVVAVPTETVYGLAANASDPAAVSRIYELKGRPGHNPVIVHVASQGMARDCVADWPPLADRLARAFWPGPLTLVLPRAATIPEIVTAGGGTVGIRWPQHPFMQALIRTCGFPLAAPSANLANGISPTNAAHVDKALGQVLPLIVDGGDCNVGIESTVVDATGAHPRILRPGMIHEPAILMAAGTGPPQPGNETADMGPLRSPGQLDRHYAPRARLAVVTWHNDAELGARMEALGAKPESTFILAHHRLPQSLPPERVFLIPDDPEAFGRALYAQLHRCDDAGAGWILVEAPPATPEWAAIADRLRRAGAPAR
ncbi:MAG: threonylcarbamoyl-AMP synthase [Verrucomicrobiae bacterium]|nr:threonylcarbamoyl-AMP synthase [Verrucomicrobiae bacterium]